MKIKKMIAAILLSLAIALPLSACGDKDKDGSSSTSATNQSGNIPSDSTSLPIAPPSGIQNGWEGPHVTLD